MKKLVLSALMLIVAMTIEAMPVKPNTHRQFTMSDGTQVTATLQGDEFGHWWITEDGQRLQIAEDGTASFVAPYEETLQTEQACARRMAANQVRRSRMHKTVAPGGKTPGTFNGDKKGLVILVNFSNLTMKSSHTQAAFYDVFNEEGYSENGHIGSVHDYFYDQSYGKMNLTFDVVGPVTVSNKYSYYGANDDSGEDKYPGTMVIEACKLAEAAGTDFSKYDWDGDGEVDQVYVIYAGYGENAGASSSTIWPHEWDLDSAKEYGDGTGSLTLDGVKINTYACSCELSGSSGSTMSGIGTACHEFSHCLGYMDLYDTSYNGGWGMNAWDVMDAGSYCGPNGIGEVPTGFSAYERWVAGWLEPTVLKANMEVTAMKDLGSTAEAYVLYNDKNSNECYILENRLNDKWFGYWEDYTANRQGMLISHLDYDETVWENDCPNTIVSASDGYGFTNNHERLTIFMGNNNKGSYSSSYGQYIVSQTVYSGHLYPYSTNNSLTSSTTPKAILYTACSTGKKYMNVPIKDIKVNSDKTMSFNTKTSEGGDTPTPDPQPTGDVIFYESFDECNGTGGNDDSWSGSIASSACTPDNDGWYAVSDKLYGADQCARIGGRTVDGDVTSPAFTLSGDAVLSFKAGAWNGSNDGTILDVKVGSSPLGTYTIEKAEWKTFTTTLTGYSGSVTLNFSGTKRFFLDEVKVSKAAAEGIDTWNLETQELRNSGIFNLAGQRVNENAKGLLIINGKKVVR